MVNVRSDMLFENKTGPINKYWWGHFVINGDEHSEIKAPDGTRTVIGCGKNIMLLPTKNNEDQKIKVRSWPEYRQEEDATGIDHAFTNNSIPPVLFERNLEVLVIGCGAENRICVAEDIVNYIRARGISDVRRCNMPKACRIYNELYNSGKRVGALLHGTC